MTTCSRRSATTDRMQYTFEQRCAERDHDPVRPVHAESAHAVHGLLRAGTVDERSADAAGSLALRPRVESVPRADHWSGEVGFPTAIVLPAQQGIKAITTSARALARVRRLRQRQDIAQGQRRTLPASCLEPGAVHQRQPVGTGVDDRRPEAGRTTNGDYVADCNVLNGRPPGPA